MIGVILTGHGRFASGLYDAVKQLVGQQEQFIAIDFPDGMSSEALTSDCQQAIKQCDSGDGVVFLTDILGGTPFRTAALLSYSHNNIEVITGCNLQLLIEMLLERESFSIEEFREEAIRSGQRGITSLWHQNQKSSHKAEEQSNGI